MLIISLRVNTTVPIDNILDSLEEIHGINCIYQISGDYSVICLAKCVEKDQQIQLLENIKRINGIEEVSTQVVMRCIKEDMRVSIPDNL